MRCDAHLVSCLVTWHVGFAPARDMKRRRSMSTMCQSTTSAPRRWVVSIFGCQVRRALEQTEVRPVDWGNDEPQDEDLESGIPSAAA